MSDVAEVAEGYSAHMTNVEVIGDQSVRVTFSDGVVRDIDLSRQSAGILGESLRDPAYFALVKLDEASDTLLWPNGAHEHGQFLYELSPEVTRT